MADSSRKRLPALVLSIVPGWGHVYWGRESLGLALFTLGAVLGFAYVNGLFVYRGEGRGIIVWTAGCLFFAVFIATWIELFLRTSPQRQEEEQRSRGNLLRQGTVAYMQGDLDTAEADFKGCLRIQPQDVEALFRLGVTLCRKANALRESGGDAIESEEAAGSDEAKVRTRATKRAARVLRKCERFDLEEKWNWEVQRELAWLETEQSTSTDSSAESEGSTEVREATSA